MKVSGFALLCLLLGSWSFGFLVAYAFVHSVFKVGHEISWFSPVVIGSFNLALGAWFIIDENKTPKST